MATEEEMVPPDDDVAAARLTSIVAGFAVVGYGTSISPRDNWGLEVRATVSNPQLWGGAGERRLNLENMLEG